MNQTIGEKIKFLRNQKGLSQSDLAKKLYFSNRTISNWERNLREVSIRNLEKLAQFFQVSIDYFTKPPSQTVPPQGAYQQIKVKKIAINDRFFYFLLILMFINTSMFWIPFQNRINAVLVFLLFWIGFLCMTMIHYSNLDRERTKTYVVPLDASLSYQTSISNKDRQWFKISLVLQYIMLILISTFYYVGIFGMINRVEVDLAFNVFLIFFYTSMTLFQCFVLIKEFITGVPKQVIPYVKHHNGFGMILHRAVVSIQYSMVIFLIIYMNGFGHTFFPMDLLLFTLVNGLSMVLLLRLMLVTNAKFYDSYRLISQQVSNHQSEILQ